MNPRDGLYKLCETKVTKQILKEWFLNNFFNTIRPNTSTVGLIKVSCQRVASVILSIEISFPR
jgi:hypothetical protein